MSEICSEKMTIYSIIGKVNQESDKVYYWKSFEKVFNAVDPIISDLEFKIVQSEQAWEKFLKKTKDGYFHMTGRKASTGGKLIWSKKNCEKICTKYIVDCEHLTFAFENSYKEMLNKYFERGKEILSIRQHEIWGKLKKENNQYLDLVVRILPNTDNGEWNQAINVFFSSKLIDKIGQSKIDKMIGELAEASSSIKIGKTTRDWDQLIAMRGNIPEIDNIMYRHYLVDENLNFRENKFGKWIEL